MKRIVRLLTALSAVLVAAQLTAATLVTKFATDPLADGWQVYGNTNLFAWDATNENLRVTWDSSQPNSYFAQPLGKTLTRADGFLLMFDLTVTDVPVMNGFQLALGLLNLSDATNANFFRGSGFQSPNLAQFDYFPDFSSIDATITDSNTTFSFTYVTQTLEMGIAYRVILIHRPGSDAISGQVFTNGQILATLPSSTAYSGFTGFQLDTLAVPSYSDVNGYGSSILAHGIVDNLAVASPLPVGVLAAPMAGQVAFHSDSNWIYTLEATTNFQSWSAAAPTVPGNGTMLTLQDTNAPVSQTFYRVRADLP